MMRKAKIVGAAPVDDDDGIPFEVKMGELTQRLYGQVREAEKLDGVIRKTLEVLGYGE